MDFHEAAATKAKKRILHPKCCKSASDDGKKAHLTP